MAEILVTLSAEDMNYCRLFGRVRNEEAIRMGKRDKYGFDRDPLVTHILGVVGELAAYKAFGLDCDLTLNTFKSKADLPDVECRYRNLCGYDLLLRPDDALNRPFVLITPTNEEKVGDAFARRPVSLVLRGWIKGIDGAEAEWADDKGGRPTAWFVPQDALNKNMQAFIRAWKSHHCP